MPEIKVGCCGFPAARSRYYARFGVVEVQKTFYQPPQQRTLARWRESAPAGFEFTLKAWQLITHTPSSPTYRRLSTPVDPKNEDRYGSFRATDEVLEAWNRTAAAARALRARVVVLQCPASFTPTAENLTSLRRFFERIEREGLLLAWEPRGDWPSDLISGLCRDLALIPCVDPLKNGATGGEPFYYRLHGIGGYRYRHTDADLERLARLCGSAGAAAAACGHSDLRRRRGYVMFNNTSMWDDAWRFLRLLGGDPAAP